MQKLKNFYKYLMLLLVVMFSFSFVACGNTPTTPPNKPADETTQPENPPAWSKNFTLPEKEDVKARLLEIYGSEEAIFLLQTNTIRRMKCPEQGEKISINFTFQMGEYQKMLFEDSVQEFNDVFSVINPNYKFKINYNPTSDDLKGYYSIRVQTVESFASSDTLGTAPMGYAGDYICNFGINIKESVLNNGSQILSVFKHELMHLLGAGDAYKNDNATKDTIMQGYSPNGRFSFSNSDVAFLDAMYRNPDAPYSNEYILESINTYQDWNVHNKTYNESAVYNKFLTSLNVQTLSAQIDELNLVNEFKLDVKNKIKNGLDYDFAFGTQAFNLGELPKQEQTENETIYLHLELNPITNKHFMNQHRYKGMSFGNSGVYLSVVSGGIVLCGLNTTEKDFYIKVGDYCLALTKSGGFDDLSNLSASANRVYKVTDMSSTAWFNFIDNYAD